MTPELKELIQNAPVEKQRAMILTILEENNVEHRLLCNEIQKTVDTEDHSEMDHIKDVVGMIRKYVKVSATEVKTMGEVMTPIELVEEMLDTLPYEVWSNPNLKWLDPCNGIGTFFSVVVERLMKGLATFQPDEKLRYKHIVEEMIFACELQAKNLFLYLYSFDPKDEYAMNIHHGSYLDKEFGEHMKDMGVDKFDVIVMNPPYQMLKEGNTNSQSLWDKFVIKAVTELVDGGYLVAVHPDGWRSVGKGFNKVKQVLKSKQMTYLEVHSQKDGLKTFGATTSYDFYCLHNVPPTFNTKIKCLDGTTQRVDISKREFIPNGMFKEFDKLIAKKGEEKVQIISDYIYEHRKSHISKQQTEEHSFPCVYLTYKDGSKQLRYSNVNKGHFGIPKVIFSNGASSSPIIDELGEYGLMEYACGIADSVQNIPYIQKALLNPEFIKLMKFSWGFDHRYNPKVIALFRKDFWKEFI